MAATHPKNWRVDPTKYTYQTDSLFTNFHPLLERWNPDIRSYDRYIHLMHAESLLRIKTEMTSTQRRDNLNIIYNHAKLMHFYMLIHKSTQVKIQILFLSLNSQIIQMKKTLCFPFFDLIPKFGQRTNKVINNEI